MDLSEFKGTTTVYWQRHPWEVTRAKIINHLLYKNKKHFHHLLDVGSGDAYILNMLCQHNIADSYSAVDTAYEAEIIERIAITTHCNIAFSKQLPNQLNPTADGVLILDVIEHCENETLILQEVNNISIAQNFILLITVPAFQSLFSKHDKMLHHYRRYSVKQLIQLCKGEGLQVEQAGYFFFSLMLLRYIQLFLEKKGLRNPHKTIDNWKGKKWITRFCTSLLWLDYKFGRFFLVLGFRLPGLSAYCICRPLP